MSHFMTEGRAMRSGLIVACLAMCMSAAVMAAPEKPLEEMTYEELLDSYPTGWSQAARDKGILIAAEMLGRGKATIVFAEKIFADGAEGQNLAKYRKHTVGFLASAGANLTSIDDAQICINSLPETKQLDAARFLDQCCKEDRPRIMEMALRAKPAPVTGGPEWMQIDYIRQSARLTQDLRLAQAIRASYKTLKDENVYWANEYMYLMGRAAGQRNLMRMAMADPTHGEPQTAFDYALKTGDSAYAARTLCAVAPEDLRNGLPQGETLTEEGAHEVLLKLAENPRMPERWRTATFTLRSKLGPKPVAPAKMSKDELEKALQQVSGNDSEKAKYAIVAVIHAGEWEHVPADFLDRVKDPTLRMHVLEDAEAFPTPASKPVMRMLTTDPFCALRAWTMLVRLREADAPAQAERLLPNAWALARAPALAALYRAGRTQHFDALVEIAKSDGLPPRARAEATRALGASPNALKGRASEVLVALLLSPYGEISTAADGALRELHPRAEVKFSPWAEDAVRKPQAENWLDHAFPR